MMEINDFSAVIELIATISVAFVAVEYVKSYTNILCERFFNFNYYIGRVFKDCGDILPDKETLDNLNPVDIDGKNTLKYIEEIKRKRESLEKEITSYEDNKKLEVIKFCHSRSMSSLCLYIFLFNVVLLFLGGVERMSPDYIHSFGFFFSLLSVLYVLIGWIFGEKEYDRKVACFSSMRHPIFSCIIFFVLTLFFVIINNRFELLCIDKFWFHSLLLMIFMSYLNFCIFIYKIWDKAKTFKKDLNALKLKLDKECSDLKNQAEELLSTNRVVGRLKAD